MRPALCRGAVLAGTWAGALALCGASGPAGPGPRDAAPPAVGQPYASYWFPDELLAWNPLADPDAPYNRSGVPLADRFTDPATQVNPHARDGEGGVTAISIMYPSTSGNPSLGGPVFDTYAFGYWPYVDLLVFWGGSAGEGLILAPSADVIDAGHRNGVPVLGTVFFPPNVYGGKIQWVQDLVQKDGADFPVADKLIEVADFYGFDGWFINQETAGGDSALALQMQEFLQYFQENKSPGQHVQWYDAMIDNGNIAWQNELNDRNAMFFEDGGRVSDTMFLNFGWATGTRLADSRAKAISLGRSPYEVHAGVDVQALGYNRNVAWDVVFPEAQPHTTSLGFYGTEWPYTSSSDHADYLARASRFWVGENRDPSNTTTADDWKGIAHYVPARSPVNDVPFVTDFNTGQGHLFAVGGEVLHTGDWNQRGLQDVLPTWRWIAESAGLALFPELDWTDAYVGGSCLKVSGDLSPGSATHLKLYKTDVLLPAQAELEVAFRRGIAGAESRLEVGLAFASDPSSFTFLPVGAGAAAGWNTATLDLSAYAGQTVSVISLRFDSPVPENGYEMRVGRLALRDGPADPPAPAAGATVEQALQLDATHASVRLRWSASPDPVRAYHVYRRNPGSGRSWVGATAGTAIFLPSVERIGGEVATVLEVEAVGNEGAPAAPDTTSLYWGPGPDNLWPCPVANGPYCAVAGEALGLSALGSLDPDGVIVSYSWTFGDGGSAAGPEPGHAWAASGTYDVVLTVTDDLGRTEVDSTVVSVTDLPPDPVPDLAWYPLDEGFGAVAGDSSGNGNDAAFSGAAWTDGYSGGALLFDGIDDYAIVPDYPKSASTLTVTAWVLAESRPQWASIAKNWALNPGAFHLGLYEDAGDLQAFIAQSNEATVGVRESVPLPLGTWQHVALVCDGEQVRLYRNGFQVDQAPYDGTLLTTRAALGIGVKTNGAGTGPNNSLPSFWHGRIDELRLYDRPLCQNEIRDLAAQGTVTGLGDALPGITARLQLSPNRPNPFTGATRIEYALPAEGPVELVVYDVTGRRVRELVRGVQPAGRHAVDWDGMVAPGRPLAPGVYFLRLEAGSEQRVRKMLRLR